MQATARLELVVRIGKGRPEPAEGSELVRFARWAMLSEAPGLAIAAITIYYIASSFAALI